MGIDTVYEQDMQTAHIIQPAEEMAAIIQQFDNIVIVAHGSPDGDAIGATGAMGSLVKALGKRFVLYNATGIPDYLEWVPLPGKLVTKPSAIPFKPGLIIVLDCGDAWRMGKELLAVFPEYPSVNIDHHLGNPMFASLGNWVDPGMAATARWWPPSPTPLRAPHRGTGPVRLPLPRLRHGFLHARQRQCGGLHACRPPRRQRP